MNNITSELQIKNTIQAQITKVTLYNALGQLYGSWTNNLEGQNISIPLLHKASGMYLVQVATSNGTIVKKIIIN
jgi:hypothetical protein